MRIFRLSALALLFCIVLASCEKREMPVALPPKGDAEMARVDMGETYSDQIFYDLSNNRVTLISECNSWDLAFEADVLGYHVFLNGGKDMFVYNTNQTDITAVKSVPAIKTEQWRFDDPSGSPDSTAVGEWAIDGKLSKGEVYIVKLNPAHFADTFKKIKIVAVSSKDYTIAYGDLKSSEFKTIVIPKDDRFNYAYFNFANGGEVTHPEPTKDSWDIVFTRYRYIYKELNNLPYLVTGVLLNPYKTTASRADSSKTFEQVDINGITNLNFSDNRNLIGFDWKSYSIEAGIYTTNKNKVYVIRNQNAQYFKIHFIDFYSTTGEKGSPTFEFQRLQ